MSMCYTKSIMSDSKYCYICKQNLPKTSFNSKKKECKKCERSKKLQYRYGINQEQYDVIYNQQNGECKICYRHSDVVGTLVVDHDHTHCSETRGCVECIRGLLCHDCNVSLGKFEDNIDRILRAAEYLKSFV